MGIRTVGCVSEARAFINGNLVVIFGTGGGVLVFQLLGLMMSATLAITIKKEKQNRRSTDDNDTIDNSDLKQ